MNSDEAKQRARELFKQSATKQSNRSGPIPDLEARSREIRKKIEYLRSIRLEAQSRRKRADSDDAGK